VIWLYILVEGPTEEAFVNLTLGPHLLKFSVHAIPIIVTSSRDPRTGEKSRGGGSWKRWVKDLHCLVGQHSRRDARFTTLFDFYGLPRDFPERKAHLACADTVQCVRSLEQAMANIVADRRFIPYLPPAWRRSVVSAQASTPGSPNSNLSENPPHDHDPRRIHPAEPARHPGDGLRGQAARGRPELRTRSSSSSRDYVITPAVEKELPEILDDMKQVFDRGEEYGRFIHGSFGSGKSHFMTMLSLLIEGAPWRGHKFARCSPPTARRAQQG
jgi:hypothetical protein